MNGESVGVCRFLNTGSDLIGWGYRCLTALVAGVEEHRGSCDVIELSGGKKGTAWSPGVDTVEEGSSQSSFDN